MPDRNETSLRECRLLTKNEFPAVYQTLTKAFSDYVVPFALTETQLTNHFVLTAVDLDRSVGCFEGNQLIGASMNGFGMWNGRPTVYDACTGVLPEHRRKGVSTDMFRFMLPGLKRSGVEQLLLEVIATNLGAVRLYEGLGFRVTRDLALLQCDTRTSGTGDLTNVFEVREIETPDWDLFKQFWDVDPSWQNSPEAVDRSLSLKRIIGAFHDGKCVGYVLFSARFGRISQMAVAKEYRRQGVGSRLLYAMHSVIDEGYSAQVVNADISAEGMLPFFRKLGYYERLRQHEMTLDL
jgi:ribosomal protein S18 acetylase RimI-like enzyme